MISEGRIPLNGAERKAVDKLMHERDGAAISLTRRDPGDTGPVLVHVDNDTYQIDETGHRKKVN
jgi:hypothetical protein